MRESNDSKIKDAEKETLENWQSMMAAMMTTDCDYSEMDSEQECEY